MVEPCGQSLRNHYVIHEPQLHRLFSLQSGTWPARGEHRHLPWPQWWNHPLHRVAGSMSVALDVPLFVYSVALRRNDFRRQRQIACREDHSVESNLLISFPEEVPGLLVRLQVRRQHAPPWKHGPAELLKALQVA